MVSSDEEGRGIEYTAGDDDDDTCSPTGRKWEQTVASNGLAFTLVRTGTGVIRLAVFFTMLGSAAMFDNLASELNTRRSWHY